jgi:hypothetical protein
VLRFNLTDGTNVSIAANRNFKRMVRAHRGRALCCVVVCAGS